LRSHWTNNGQLANRVDRWSRRTFTPEPAVSLPSSAGEILKKHITLEVESIDRMYLNVYVPRIQYDRGVVGFFRFHRGHKFASTALMSPMTVAFVKQIERFAEDERVDLVAFDKGERKDDIARRYLAGFEYDEGVLFIGKAQEKAWVFRSERRNNTQTGKSYAFIVRTTAMVNHYYFYCVDSDFGPFFLKFCSYFPYTAKLCINGNEYLKRQLDKRRIAYEPLDNGILSCAEPRRLQAIADGLTAHKIDTLLRKWLRRLPHPFTAADRKAGYRYDLSIVQAEFSLTQVLDRPVTGRIFFEEVIRENLDLGRPSRVQLLFDRRICKNTPGRFRTRVVTNGVTPSLHVDYKNSHIKQYHKESRALRTETTINDPRDFCIGKRLQNLPALRKIGFQANRRLLHVQQVSHDCAVGEDAFRRVDQPAVVAGQRVPALRFSDPRVQALLSVLLLFLFLPRGFSNGDLRPHLARFLGLDPNLMTPGRMSYDLRRLRLHGLIKRIPKSHRYRLTPLGLRTALFFTRVYSRVLRPGLTHLTPVTPATPPALRTSFEKAEKAVLDWCEQAKLAA